MRFTNTFTVLAATLVCVTSTTAPAANYRAVVARLQPFIEHEMRSKELPAISIALVDDQKVVWSQGFGFANPEDSVRATAKTIYRVGSVSKLFTDIAVMQLVEQGKLDLDAPVSRYVPGFHPHNPFGGEITLRELMSHRSGLVREPPVGHYFDDGSPTLQQTIASLNDTKLVYAPNTKTKYSNAAIALVGDVLATVQKQRFESYLKHAVLDPAGMSSSAFARDEVPGSQIASAYMWTLDGRTFPAPTFDLGMAPLSGLDASAVAPLWNQLGTAIFGHGERFYNFQGVRDFKEWFHPVWEPKYLVSSGGAEDMITLPSCDMRSPAPIPKKEPMRNPMNVD